MKISKYIAATPILFLTAYTISCSKMDAYKGQYMKDGSITYAGKMDSVQIHPGRNRVKLTGLFTSDPNIAKYRVFWNSRQDSVEVAVTRTSGVDTAKVIISNLEEGSQSFEVRTYDKLGHTSVPTYVLATVYGDNYQASLVNRGVADASRQTDSSALITWADITQDAGVLNMEIQYSDNNNAHDTIIPSVIIKQTTTLPHIKFGSPFTYKTAYIPTPDAIDTFYTAYQSHTVKTDVTSVYLSNVGPGFQRNTYDGRWGTLAAPWVTNAAAKNKDGGVNGGYTSDSWWGNTGQINWETWNNTPVTDGKIYQPTSIPLPAGNYTVTFQYYSEIQTNSTVYCIAAAGANGIPSLPDLSSALGYTLLYNGAAVGTTTPNLTETRSFSFSLTSPQVVSIGFLGNLVGNGNPGNYFVVGYIQLIQN